jgi:hypothetical protein
LPYLNFHEFYPVIKTTIMKKYLLWLPVAVVIGAAIYQPVTEAMTVKPVDKSISFAVYKDTGYSSDIYNNTSAQLHITIEKVKGNIRTQMWSKTFDAKLLKQYPTLQEAMSQTVVVPKVLAKERLEIAYTIIYNSGGSELQMQNASVVAVNAMTGKFDIRI